MLLTNSKHNGTWFSLVIRLPVPDRQRWAFTQLQICWYRDKLSAIVIGDNQLPIIVIAQYSFGLSITNIVFVIYFVIVHKLSR